MSDVNIRSFNVFQAISTKFYGPTNTRGGRVKASCDAGSLTIPYDHGNTEAANHANAAKALAAKLQWDGQYFGGSLNAKAGGYVFVCRNDCGGTFFVDTSTPEPPMTLEQIKEAVDAGRVVHWAGQAYEVKHWPDGKWVIFCRSTQYASPLTKPDGVTVNGKLEDFFLA